MADLWYQLRRLTLFKFRDFGRKFIRDNLKKACTIMKKKTWSSWNPEEGPYYLHFSPFTEYRKHRKNEFEEILNIADWHLALVNSASSEYIERFDINIFYDLRMSLEQAKRKPSLLMSYRETSSRKSYKRDFRYDEIGFLYHSIWHEASSDLIIFYLIS